MAARELIGLDIGSTAIKAVILAHESNPPRLLSLGQVATPQPGFLSDNDQDLENLAGAIKQLVSGMQSPTKEVAVSLPEARVFTRVIYDLPFLTDEELSQAIRYAAEEFVPMPMQDVNLNYQVLARSASKGPNSRTVVLVVATPKPILDKYLRVLNMADLRPVSVETEIVASSRSLVGANPFSPTTLIIQLGAMTTDYAVIHEGLILITRSISTGGIALTRAITQLFNFEISQAEEYKKVYGLLEDQLEGKLVQAIRPIVTVITSEAKKVIQAYEAQNKERPVKRVILTGGGASLPGLVIFFANSLGLEIQEGDPWFAIAKDPKLLNKLSAEASTYAVAAGLALWER
ncbi:hypothetical protein A2631_03565 [Candidatus Daviesbacteria bacterium RIFCSPHIGHO2_01_FULL_44_29]|uniref:SHS2 domain-containing protein n=1 Tax=Candidatus Daviesbacteria bacterium RIFCSPHIGHO2_02_FULL_43_12 TaxID=1797776 RepID=A0A1F5KFY6_9BACT|nr:MAG: hypothetical protein A2631_03565 [Candidatus Daviesbacteria bacterium RIFCSPHIGHO2_01_FULL_44_29]OGE38823.1 MAG: hypothetical protein A3E86_02820 [Candidatus Daviesbacteria bacterium RIFCSPHIGHO2_12_FULL_47_45]OGE39720.1 MAG: hypothetical protein A3D25_03260 [Candidatus Daviesbacteria bacterium RIFCSPHIGHO2_02_FULL_43_12]OGE69989.1 MAG: hypothetical protein A3B55_04830 [Candidatus Daviesbacteria bacterium RIFCSPLOWO2_01_FULL_43_15]